jgi:hypothetical protein
VIRVKIQNPKTTHQEEISILMIAGAGRDLHNLPLLEHLPDRRSNDHDKMLEIK